MGHNSKLFLFEPTYLAVAPKPSRTAPSAAPRPPLFRRVRGNDDMGHFRYSKTHCRYSKALYYKRDRGNASGYTAGFDLRREAGSAPKSGCSSEAERR